MTDDEPNVIHVPPHPDPDASYDRRQGWNEGYEQALRATPGAVQIGDAIWVDDR